MYTSAYLLYSYSCIGYRFKQKHVCFEPIATFCVLGWVQLDCSTLLRDKRHSFEKLLNTKSKKSSTCGETFCAIAIWPHLHICIFFVDSEFVENLEKAAGKWWSELQCNACSLVHLHVNVSESDSLQIPIIFTTIQLLPSILRYSLPSPPLCFHPMLRVLRSKLHFYPLVNSVR
jgi:hypothetical protein